jgi:hypothetical protein
MVEQQQLLLLHLGHGPTQLNYTAADGAPATDESKICDTRVMR